MGHIPPFITNVGAQLVAVSLDVCLLFFNGKGYHVVFSRQLKETS